MGLLQISHDSTSHYFVHSALQLSPYNSTHQVFQQIQPTNYEFIVMEENILQNFQVNNTQKSKQIKKVK